MSINTTIEFFYTNKKKWYYYFHDNNSVANSPLFVPFSLPNAMWIPKKATLSSLLINSGLMVAVGNLY